MVRSVLLPWSAWHDDTTHELPLPASWQVNVLSSRESPALNDAEIEAKLASPIGAPPLEVVARGRRSACVVTDDLARPTKMERPLAAVLSKLESGGMPRDQITVVIATGTHAALDAADLRRKVGAFVFDRYRVVSHSPDGDLDSAGVEYGGQPLRVNRAFLSADLRILLGSVIPHPFAQFSGGAKLVIPGLCDLDATERTHKFVLMGLRESSSNGTNAFRQEIEALVAQIGVHWTVGVLPNVGREPADLVAGDLVLAHREACLRAKEQYRTPLDTEFDCLVVNAYPKDVDLIQSQNALGVLRLSPLPVRSGGIVVLATAAVRGVGIHGLFAPGGRTYRAPVKNRTIGDRTVWLYAPSLSDQQARSIHWSGYPFFSDANAMAAALESELGRSATAGVIPGAVLQWLDDRRSRPAP